LEKGYDNSLLKIARIFIVFFSWLVIATTCKTPPDLFKSTFIFLLGLTYDYLCIFDASRELVFQKVVSIIAICCIIIIGIIDLLGLFNILVPASSGSRLLQIDQGSNILTNFRLSMSFISWLLLIFPAIACLEIVPVFRRHKSSTREQAVSKDKHNYQIQTSTTG
jgi:hypothetical protein